MHVTAENRYDKEIIEPFAISTIAKSYDPSYAFYYSPKDTDNFDYISEDGLKAVEISLIVPQNEIRGFVYQKELQKGKVPSFKKINEAKVNDEGQLIYYNGGSMSEVKRLIRERLEEKNEKALKRIEKHSYQAIDLCFCVADGSLFDCFSFELAFADLKKYVFDNIFFITPSHFIRYSKENGFQEYARIV